MGQLRKPWQAIGSVRHRPLYFYLTTYLDPAGLKEPVPQTASRMAEDIIAVALA